MAAGGVALGLRKVDDERIPRIAMLSAAFFVASLIHVPIGPSSAHLVLNGLAGVVIGWAAFPAMLVALLLQAILFGFGGLTTLGVNTVVMAGPAVVCHYLFAWGVRGRGPTVAFVCGLLAGGVAVLLSALLVCVALVTTGKAFAVVAGLVVAAHVPVAVIEGLITGCIAGFLRKVKPELLDLHAAAVEGPNAHA